MASFKLNIIANYAGKSWAAILGIVLIPIYIKFLGIEAYGLIGFYATLFSVMGMLNFGIGTVVNRELARYSAGSYPKENSRDLVRTLEVVVWIIAIFSAIVVVFLAPTIATSWVNAENLQSGTITETIQLMAISIAFRFPLALYQGGLMGMQKQVLVNLILIISGTLRGGGAILVLWLVSPTIQAYFIWQVLISLISSLAFLFAIWNNLPSSTIAPRFKKEILMGISRFAIAVSGSAIIGIILSQLDKIILSKMLPLKTFAYYSIATTAASLIWMFIIPFESAVFPRLVQKFEEKNKTELVDFFHNSSQILSLIVIPPTCVLIFYSPEILSMWLGDSEVVQNSYLITSLLAFGILLNGLAQIPATSATAFGWPSLITYTNMLQATLIIPLIIILTNYYGGVGAATAWIVMNSTYILFMIPVFFKKHLKSEKKKWYLNDIIIPCTVSFGVCLISKVISPRLDSNLYALLWITLTSLTTLITTALSLKKIKKLLIDKTKFKIV